jgi:hypothetical protein
MAFNRVKVSLLKPPYLTKKPNNFFLKQWTTFARQWYLFDARWQDPIPAGRVLSKYLLGKVNI